MLPAANFGQREHLAVLLMLPYTLVRLNEDATSSDTNYRTLVALSLVAGFGFSLKPHFGLPWLATQIVVTRRDVSIRNLSLIGLTALPMAIQLLAIPIFFRDLIGLYQLFGRQYVEFGKLPVSLIIEHYLYLPMAAVLVISLASQVHSTRRSLVRGLAWISLAWFVTGAMQGKGWSYHFLPAHITLMIGVLFTILYLDGSRRATAVRGLVTVCMVLIGLTGLRGGVTKPNDPVRRSLLPASLRGLPDGSRALVLSIRMTSAYPLLGELHARNVGSFPVVWPLQVEYGKAGIPGQLIPVRHPEEMKEPESILYRTVVDDLIRYKPELVLVSDGNDPAFNDAYFDYVAYFSQDESFRNEMSSYVMGPRLGHLQFYVKSDSGS
jgi:hypothetical protein